METLAGPSTHICWTPDSVPPEKREVVVLVRHSDWERAERLEAGLRDWLGQLQPASRPAALKALLAPAPTEEDG